MKKFLARIRQFLRNIFGYQNTEEIRLQTAQIENSSTTQKAMTMDLIGKIDLLIAAMNKNTMENLNGLNSIFNLFSQRPIVPLIMNDKGYLLNLAVEKKMKMECTSDGEIINFKIIVDHTHTFMNVEVNMQRICVDNLNKEEFKDHLPVMQYARVLLKNGEKKSRLLDRIALIAMSKLVVRAQHQMIDQTEAFYLFADTILGVVKPLFDEKDKEVKTKVEFPDSANGRKAKEKFEKETGIKAELSLLSDQELEKLENMHREHKEELNKMEGLNKIVNEAGKEIENKESQNETGFNIIDNREKVEESKIN